MHNASTCFPQSSILISLLLLPTLARPLPVAGQILVSGGDYTQNFDTLASAGTANTWTDNSTLPGWYAAAVNGFGGDYRAGSGTSTTGDLYSFGLNGDRALGSLSSSTPGNLAYGVRIRNDTGGDRAITISYGGEQWRDANTTVQSLLFSYKISSTALASADAGNAPGSGGWIAVDGLNFNSPQHANPATKPTDGNAAANRTALGPTGLPGVTLSSGAEIFLRWYDLDDPGSDQALGIDDLQLSFTAVPEPQAYATMVGFGLLLFAVYRRRRR